MPIPPRGVVGNPIRPFSCTILVHHVLVFVEVRIRRTREVRRLVFRATSVAFHVVVVDIGIDLANGWTDVSGHRILPETEGGGVTTSDVVGHVPRTVGVSSVLFSSQAARDTSTDELDLAPTVLEMPQRKGKTEVHEDPVGSPLVC